ncbi:uncharacterized protein NEMAJ01_0846 [Nematocida major]|uniref:uncharacterized protein n=1 Tax=Nematocida major TaxID=1912982 RepID=UPI0020073E6B|nr:uncharacterized protein NEMAJ01_0846 [Nematocida major]KAH9385950.1 hypothetical protein NEMAJ01_0846 [Nematocida major]
MFDPYEEIKSAEKAHTLSEQKEHISAVKEAVGHLIKKDKPLENLHEIHSQLEGVQKAQEATGKPVKLSSDLIAKVKALSEHPIVKRAVERRPAVQKNCRTLFDYTG